ncbi:MAG: chemotaxis protein CheA [Candidatus Tectomicrobia bacterium]|uniref:Chemotaxis protein CheA n=1 Tax=Tectimicrobiota bacterium TaxID=2528274 RepID=A0A932CL33_UNCTE|nr:chemotaxis protein CheA [Candidatus Tectomicrobia bacterium]
MAEESLLAFDLTPEELQVFLQEAEEHLQVLDEEIVRLEQEGNDPGLLQEIFRAAHTLKGSSGAIGHHRMADLTHAMETVLDGLRKGSLTVSPDLVDALLEGLDLLRALKEEVVTGRMSQVKITTTVTKLQGMAEGLHSRPSPPATPPFSTAYPEGVPGIPTLQEPAAPDPHPQPESIGVAGELLLPGSSGANGAPSPQDLRIYQVSASISPGSLAPAIRALQVLMELGQLGEILSSSPSAEEIDAQKVDHRIEVVLASREEETRLRAALNAIMDLEGIEIAPPAGDPPPPAREEKDASPPVRGPEKDPEPQIPPEERRIIDLGPAARGKLDKETLEKIADYQATKQANTVRISVERLDTLVDLVGELVTYRNRFYKINGDLTARYGEEPLMEALGETSAHIGTITDQLQAEVMKARMLPLEIVFSKFPRLVRDVARKAGKEVELVIRGQDTELDRSVIEMIGDPLTHLLRNSVDHGLEAPEERRQAGKPEKGQIRLAARHEESYIIITVEDDGRGIDLQRVKESAVSKGFISAEEARTMGEEEAKELIFLAGLSTARKISDVSGRGVGMDVVKTNVERVNGSIAIFTEKGKGTTFEIRLPLTLAFMPTLLVSLRGRTYLIPLSCVIETVRIGAKEVKTIKEREVMQLRGHVLPLIRLEEILGLNGASRPERQFVVILRAGDAQVGLMVDSLLGQEEVVIKSLGGIVGDLEVISGATILGDGRVALILNILGLIEIARRDRGILRA